MLTQKHTLDKNDVLLNYKNIFSKYYSSFHIFLNIYFYDSLVNYIEIILITVIYMVKCGKPCLNVISIDGA